MEKSKKIHNSSVFIHTTSNVATSRIGNGTKIWQFCVVLENANIGSNCNICSHCFIENDVFIGNNVTIKNNISLYDGIFIEDNVFIGPNVCFTNDKYPKSKIYPTDFLKTHICKGVSIGAGAIILPGVTIGENTTIGAGAIITKNIPANSIVYCKTTIISTPKKHL